MMGDGLRGHLALKMEEGTLSSCSCFFHLMVYRGEHPLSFSVIAGVSPVCLPNTHRWAIRPLTLFKLQTTLR